MIVKMTRKIEIDAGHRIATHGGMCRGLHGHRYVIEARCFGDVAASHSGPASDMIIDFGFLKEVMMDIIHAQYDHSLILAWDDPVATIIAGAPVEIKPNPSYTIAPYSPFFTKLTLIEHAPTAERLAELWFKQMEKEISGMAMVTVYETPNCWASFTL